MNTDTHQGSSENGNDSTTHTAQNDNDSNESQAP